MSRRRPRFQNLRKIGVLDQNGYVLIEKGINPNPPIKPPELAATRAHCAKCGKYFGSGKAFHEKFCKGLLDTVPNYRVREKLSVIRGAQMERTLARRELYRKKQSTTSIFSKRNIETRRALGLPVAGDD